MAAKINIKLPLPDKTKLKTMGAKFNAWWNGTEYVAIDENSDEALQKPSAANDGENPENGQGELAASENSPNEDGVGPSAPVEKVAPPKPIISANSNIFASSVLWGAGRLTPANPDFDLCLIRELGLNKNSKFGLFCAEAGAQSVNIIKSANCKTEAYFMDAAQKDAASVYIKNNALEKLFSAKSYDGSPKSVPKNRFDKVLMQYCSSTKEQTESHIFALSRMLKPKGVAAWVNFIARGGENRLEETSGNERRQFLSQEELIPAFEASGLVIAAEEECGADLLNAYYKRQSQIMESWEQIQGQLMQKGGIEAVQAALDQTLVWRARIDAIKSGRLHLRKLIVTHG